MYSNPTVNLRPEASPGGLSEAVQRESSSHNNSHRMFRWDKFSNPTCEIKKPQKSREEQREARAAAATGGGRGEDNAEPNTYLNRTKQMKTTKQQKTDPLHHAVIHRKRPATALTTARSTDSNWYHNPRKAHRHHKTKFVNHPENRDHGMRSVMHHKADEPWLDPFADVSMHETIDGHSMTMKSGHVHQGREQGRPHRGAFGKPGEKMHGTYGLHRPQSAMGRMAVERYSASKCVDPRFPWGNGARGLLSANPVPFSSQTRSVHSEGASVLGLSMGAKSLQFRHKLRNSIEHQFPHLQNPLYNGQLAGSILANGQIASTAALRAQLDPKTSPYP